VSHSSGKSALLRVPSGSLWRCQPSNLGEPLHTLTDFSVDELPSQSIPADESCYARQFREGVAAPTISHNAVLSKSQRLCTSVVCKAAAIIELGAQCIFTTMLLRSERTAHGQPCTIAILRAALRSCCRVIVICIGTRLLPSHSSSVSSGEHEGITAILCAPEKLLQQEVTPCGSQRGQSSSGS